MSVSHYLTVAEIKDSTPEDVLKWLTDGRTGVSPATWAVVDSKIETARDQAEATADSWIVKRYKVPLDLVALEEKAAQRVKLAVLLLSRYYLYANAEQADLTVAKGLFMQAIGSEASPGTLRQIASGAIELPGAEAIERTLIKHDAPKRVFGAPPCRRERNF